MKKNLLAVALIGSMSLGACANNPLNIQNAQDGGVKGAVVGAASGVGVALLSGKNPLAGAIIGGAAGYAIGHHYGLSIEEAKKVAAEIRQESHYRVAVHESYAPQKTAMGGYQKVAYMDSMTLAVPNSALKHHAPIAQRTLMKIGALSAKTEKRTLMVKAKTKKDFDYIAQELQAGSQQPLNVVYAGRETGRDAHITLQNDVIYVSNAGHRA